MLVVLPFVLACHVAQPCQPVATIPNLLVRSSSPSAIVSVTQPLEDQLAGSSRPLRLALQRVSIWPASGRPHRSRAQVARPGRAGTSATEGMLVLDGVIAGCYVGGYLGLAMEEEGGFLGMPIGAAVGGVVAWTLVK